MFSFFKNKGAAKTATVVHADAGATLVRQAAFPNAASGGALACTPKELALDGVPPKASLREQPIQGQTTTAYVVENLAFLNVRGTQGDIHIEVWELESSTFKRKRNVALDPRQGVWVLFRLSQLACLPGNKFLLAVSYHDPHVKQALFLYDATKDSYTKIADIKPYADNRDQFFDAQSVAPDAVIVQYFTDTIRLAPEVYYNTPSHLRLFTPRHPQGIELVQLSAADGSVRRFAVVDKTLWIDALDYREKHQPKELIWSLNLENVLPR